MRWLLFLAISLVSSAVVLYLQVTYSGHDEQYVLLGQRVKGDKMNSMYTLHELLYIQKARILGSIRSSLPMQIDFTLTFTTVSTFNKPNLQGISPIETRVLFLRAVSAS